MNSILLLNASPLGTNSRAYVQARYAADNILGRERNVRLVERDLVRDGPTAISESHADAVINGEVEGAGTFDQSEKFIRELEDCDRLIIATPMHNFAVPAVLKLWIDYVVRTDRTFTRRDGVKVGLLPDRPALVVLASGGLSNGAGAMQPDFVTPYLTHVLATIGIKDVRFAYLQGLGRPDLALQSTQSVVRQIDQDPIFGLPQAAVG